MRSWKAQSFQVIVQLSFPVSWIGTKRKALANGRTGNGHPDTLAVHSRAATPTGADISWTSVGAAGLVAGGRRPGLPSASGGHFARWWPIRRVQRALSGARWPLARSVQALATCGADWSPTGSSQICRDHRSHLRTPNAHSHSHPLALPQFQDSQRKFPRYFIKFRLRK